MVNDAARTGTPAVDTLDPASGKRKRGRKPHPVAQVKTLLGLIMLGCTALEIEAALGVPASMVYKIGRRKGVYGRAIYDVGKLDAAMVARLRAVLSDQTKNQKYALPLTTAPSNTSRIERTVRNKPSTGRAPALTHWEVNAVRDMFENRKMVGDRGWDITSLAAHFDVSYSTVRKIILRLHPYEE